MPTSTALPAAPVADETRIVMSDPPLRACSVRPWLLASLALSIFGIAPPSFGVLPQGKPSGGIRKGPRRVPVREGPAIGTVSGIQNPVVASAAA